MTREELRMHPEYQICMEKIRKYTPGFILRMDFTQIPVAKANALKVVLRDAVAMGYLESVSMEINLDMEATAETYRRRAT